MHHYQHHIGDFNNATRHLTRLEKSIYRDLIELYYETEMPLQCDRIALARRTLVRGDAELEAMDAVLAEFFTLEDGFYHHSRCDAELARVYEKSASARLSAEKRWSKHHKKTAKNADGMRSHSDGNAIGMLPITHNPLPNKDKTLAPSPPAEALAVSPTVTTVPTNRFNTNGETFRITEDMLPDWEAAYPAVDVRQEILKAKTWLQDNPTKRKTVRGMRKFLGAWLSRQQDRGQPNAEIRRNQPPGASRQSKSDAIREATFSDNW